MINIVNMKIKNIQNHKHKLYLIYYFQSLLHGAENVVNNFNVINKSKPI